MAEIHSSVAFHLLQVGIEIDYVKFMTQMLMTV
jgi:hypothetical protein